MLEVIEGCVEEIPIAVGGVRVYGIPLSNELQRKRVSEFLGNQMAMRSVAIKNAAENGVVLGTEVVPKKHCILVDRSVALLAEQGSNLR